MGRSVSKPKLLLLTRPGCHLCEEFREELEDAFPGRFELNERCVDDQPDWSSRFGREIPVLLDSKGQPVSRTRLDVAAVGLLLRRKKAA